MSDMTPKQAEENFLRSRDAYYQAAVQKAYWDNEERNAREKRNYASAKMSGDRTQKINFEERLMGIRNIIQTLEGGGWRSEDVPASIQNANAALTSVNDSYRQCIRLSSGAAADMERVFRAQSVPEDFRHSGKALDEFRREAVRLEAAIEDLKRQIAAYEGQISALTNQINVCSAEQASCRKTMWVSSYDMAHYRSAMF